MARRTTVEMKVIRAERAVQQLQQARENLRKIGPDSLAVKAVTAAIDEAHHVACMWRGRRAVERDQKRDAEMMAYHERENRL